MQGNTQITDAMVEAFIAAFNGGIFDNAAFGLPENERCRCKKCLQEEAAAIATVREGLAAALAGHVVVPREPTEAMIAAGDDLVPVARGTESYVMSRGRNGYPEDIYRAMISAAPPAQREG